MTGHGDVTVFYFLSLVVRIGFEMPSYTVTEGESNVTKCVVSNGSLERDVVVTVTIMMNGEAESEQFIIC